MTKMNTNCKRDVTLFHVVIVVFQVIFLVIFMKTKASAEMIEGCIESNLTLSCIGTKVISISSVVLGDSTGCSGTNCCPKPNSCTRNPNANHVREVHSRCNGRQTCSVDVIKERISCESNILVWHNNDFERITYDCIGNENKVEGCVGSRLNLRCNGTKMINVSSVVLGDSDCWRTSCCPKNNSCIRNPNANHVKEVHSRCNGRQTCSVDVITEGISCGSWGKWSNNDFERITYDCIDSRSSPLGSVSNLLTDVTSSDSLIMSKNQMTTESKREMTSTDSILQNVGMVDSSDVCLRVLIVMACMMACLVIIIIILVIKILKGKKLPIHANLSPVKFSDVCRDNNEATYAEIENGSNTYETVVKPSPEDCSSMMYDRVIRENRRTSHQHLI